MLTGLRNHDGELWFSAAAAELSLAKSAVILKHPCLETSRGRALHFLLVRRRAVSQHPRDAGRLVTQAEDCSHATFLMGASGKRGHLFMAALRCS